MSETSRRMSASPFGYLLRSRVQSPIIACQPSSMTAHDNPNSLTLGSVPSINAVVQLRS